MTIMPTVKQAPVSGGKYTTTVQPGGNPALPQMVPPPTGLIGSEMALGGALAGSQSVLSGGLMGGLDAIKSGTGAATGTLKAASGSVAGPQGFGTGMGEVNTAIEQGIGNFGQFIDYGQGAAQLQAALTGSLGPEAQAQAYEQYQSSPAMQYQMDQMMKATERSAAARGGLMSGNLLTELQRNAAGIASQDYQNQFNNMSQVSNTGLTAAGQVAGLRGTQAGIAGQLQQADIASKTQQQIAAQEIKANLARQIAEAQHSAGIQSAGLIQNTSGLMSQDIMNTGSMAAAGRMNAGQSIAQNATQAASQISNLLNQQGVVVSDMMAKDISTLTDILFQSGLGDANSGQQLAAILANIAGGQSSNVMQGNIAIGQANAAGTIGVGNAIQGGIQQGIANWPQQPPPQSTNIRPSQPVTTVNTGAQFGGYA